MTVDRAKLAAGAARGLSHAALARRHKISRERVGQILGRTGKRGSELAPASTPFAAWISRSKLTIEQVADALGAAEDTIRSWRSGRHRPGLAWATKIEALTTGEVKASSWHEQKAKRS